MTVCGNIVRSDGSDPRVVRQRLLQSDGAGVRRPSEVQDDYWPQIFEATAERSRRAHRCRVTGTTDGTHENSVGAVPGRRSNPMHASPHRRHVVIPTLLFLAACGGGGGGGSTPPPTSESDVLGDLAAESNYAAQVLAGALIEIRENNDIPYSGFATIEDGRRIIYLNSAMLSLQPLEFRRLVLFHEIGHHYADHAHRSLDCFYVEAEANAYGARVQFALDGSPAVQVAANAVQQLGCPQDAAHPSCAEQAAHIRDVLALVEVDSSQSPVIPYTRCGPQVWGYIKLYNPLNEPVNVYLNGALFGALYACQSGTISAVPGTHRVDVQGFLSSTFGFFPIVLGESTSAWQFPPECAGISAPSGGYSSVICGGLQPTLDWPDSWNTLGARLIDDRLVNGNPSDEELTHRRVGNSENR